jgi:hypothetical protein
MDEVAAYSRFTFDAWYYYSDEESTGKKRRNI